MNNEKLARIVVGLGFGDEGKGTMTDFFCRHGKADLVVRYNGGSQAAHNVVTDEGQHHTFAQFGSGTFIPHIKTLISRYMLWDPIALAHEAAALSPKLGHFALDRHFIDVRAPVITPFHVVSNHVKEWMRGGDKHGSCGKGIGETMFDVINHPHEVIRAVDLTDATKLKVILKKIADRKFVEVLELKLKSDGILPPKLLTALEIFKPEKLDGLLSAYASMAQHFHFLDEGQANDLIRTSQPVFEGAQGVLLDEWYGFHPYTTWSRTLADNAHSLIKESGFDGEVEVVGITRSYTTRHGAGPFPSDDASMYGISPGEHNIQNAWQDNFRSGALDLILLEYATKCMHAHGGLDSIAVTHVDVLQKNKSLPYVYSYAYAEDAPLKEILPSHDRNLDYQSQLTKTLERVLSHSVDRVTDNDELFDLIETSTGAPVKYESYGPRPRDKKVSKGYGF